MKEILISLLFLIPCSINFYIQEVPIGSSNPTSLSTTTNYKYFYAKVPSVSYSYLYFYFTDTSNGFSNPSYCVTEKDPNNQFTVGTCSFVDLYLYNSKTSGKIKEYFYEGRISRDHPAVQNVIVKYSTTGSSLNVQISYEDIYKKLNKKLSTKAIVGICVGCLMLLLVASFFIRVYIKKRLLYKNSAVYASPQPAVNNSGPLYPPEGSNPAENYSNSSYPPVGSNPTANYSDPSYPPVAPNNNYPGNY